MLLLPYFVCRVEVDRFLASAQRNSGGRFLREGNMKNPLDSLVGTVIAGVVITVVMVWLVMVIAGGGA